MSVPGRTRALVRGARRDDPAPRLLRRVLRSMKLIRAVEEGIAERYGEGLMRCPVHLCTGQEAVPAAVGALLRRGDLVVSTHRSHGHYLAKGGNLGALLAEIYGREGGCCGGRGGSMHLTDPAVGFVGSTSIVGGSIPVGTGCGLALSLGPRRGRVSCVFLGEGATEEGVFYESASFAALRKLPVLFVCENNFFSVYTPLSERQPAGRSIHKMVAGMGVPSAAGDGYDPEAVCRLTARALAHVRAGKGPFFLEFTTYRWREHCGPNFDDELGYRPEDEIRCWQERDPLADLERRLLRRAVLGRPDLERMNRRIGLEVEAGFRFALASPYPDAAGARRGVFAQPLGTREEG